ncbi:glucokinase [Pseudophaeobacter arcticus]|jgi:glucokinase|uniref:glucokinase n=1 Tax=Pseudophaeobacter arcticus TaxID=385492 RepID=UPI0039E2C4E8
MRRLVVDLGGTNCRLALSTAAGQPLQAVQSYQNDNFASFADLLGQYRSDAALSAITEMVIAVAGPVQGATGDQFAQVTNRGWDLSSRGLSKSLGEIPVCLLNDLSALGHSLTYLEKHDIAEIQPLSGADPLGQKLVIGIGTGFNVSPVITTDHGVVSLKSEFGHIALPLDLYQALRVQIGARADDFATVEGCFSGRGFAALYAAWAPEAPPLHSAAAIMAAASQNDSVAAFVAFYATLLARLSRNLIKGFLPRGGLYFAGTLARNLLTSPARSAFVQAYRQPDPQFPELTAPVFCILDDGAALKGCAGVPLPKG